MLTRASHRAGDMVGRRRRGLAAAVVRLLWSDCCGPTAGVHCCGPNVGMSRITTVRCGRRTVTVAPVAGRSVRPAYLTM